MKLNDNYEVGQKIGRYFIVMLLFPLAGLIGCKRLVEVPAPDTSLNSANVYSSDATAISAVTGIYSSIGSNGPYSTQLPGMSGMAGLSADELTLYSGVSSSFLNFYYLNALTNNDGGQDFWLNIYPIIYMANAAIEGLGNNNSLTPAIQQQLLGEAEFDRAFCYFYLVNLYGSVPLVLTTNYKVNATLARASASLVWQQIVQDLNNAASILSPDYLDGTLLNNTSERVRPTKWAAIALLARSYLYMSNWEGADSAASVLIGNSQYRLTGLDSVFLTTSNEAIWQLEPVVYGYDTPDAQAFVLPSTGPDNYQHYAYLNDSLVSSFEPNDLRRSEWIDSVNVGGATYYYPFKYQNASLDSTITEYTTVLRLGEQYLIRAEAEAELNNLATAANDLNTIRSRAGLDSTTAVSQSGLLTAIMHERRVELFTEWGHRWLDLKRTSTVNTVMGADGACSIKGGNWSTNWQLYPIPLTELEADPNLTQNLGY